jgi:hypothetical protein
VQPVASCRKYMHLGGGAGQGQGGRG